jgi:hypothetical protein
MPFLSGLKDKLFVYLHRILKNQPMKLLKLLTVTLVVLSLNSCSITEKMIINENGSGKFAYDIDGSKMMSMMGSAFKEMGEDVSKKSKKKKKKGKEEIAEQTNDSKKVVDSTFTFKELFASKQDSISKLPIEEQEKIKKMERFSVRTVIDEEKGIMNYSMFTDFNTIAELQDVMSPLQSMKSLSPTGQKAGGLGMAPDALEDKSSTQYFYDGKTFKKTVSKLEKKKEEAKEEISEESAALSEELKLKESFEMFYDQSNFKIVYQFPKAVKKVSIENALYSEDRKTITIEYP